MNFEEAGIGTIDKIDKCLAQKIPTIQHRFSNTAGYKYYLNACQHCDSIQGINFAVYNPIEIMNLSATEFYSQKK